MKINKPVQERACIGGLPKHLTKAGFVLKNFGPGFAFSKLYYRGEVVKVYRRSDVPVNSIIKDAEELLKITDKSSSSKD